jgi:hypothetical protein
MEGIRTTNALRPSGSLHVELLVRCFGACQNQLSMEALYLEGADCTGRKLIMSRAGKHGRPAQADLSIFLPSLVLATNLSPFRVVDRAPGLPFISFSNLIAIHTSTAHFSSI